MPYTFGCGITPSDHWELFPSDTLAICKAVDNTRIAKVNERLRLDWIQASLIGQAFNGSLPKEPPQIKTREQREQEENDSIINFVKQLRGGI